MKKTILASAALLAGTFGTVLLGANSPAFANPTWSCHNDTVVGIVDCSTVVAGNDVSVVIKDVGNADADLRALNGNEITVLENSLDNIGNNLTINVVKDVVVNVYKSFNPPIDIQTGEITVCIASVCG